MFHCSKRCDATLRWQQAVLQCVCVWEGGHYRVLGFNKCWTSPNWTGRNESIISRWEMSRQIIAFDLWARKSWYVRRVMRQAVNTCLTFSHFVQVMTHVCSYVTKTQHYPQPKTSKVPSWTVIFFGGCAGGTYLNTFLKKKIKWFSSF